MPPVTAQANSPGATPARKGRSSIDVVDILVFIIPCLQFIRISVIGVLSGTDLMFLVTFLYLVFRGRLRIATPIGKWILILCSLWLASQCLTDIVRHSAFADYARGWSGIGLTFVNLAVLWTLLYGRPQRVVLFGWGLVVGDLLLFFLNRPEGMDEGTFWKFGFADPVSLGVFLFASRKECRGHWPVTFGVTIGIINILLGSRSEGGVCLAAALYLVVTRVSRRRNPGISKLKARTVLALSASILLSVAGVMWSYGRAASAGILGEDAKDKYEQESSGKYGVLLGGRPELLSELPAIYDSPILGHGSWSKDPIYLIEEHQALKLLGYGEEAKLLFRDELRQGFIPAHSYFFQAWVDAGILGAVFWGWMFILTARVMLRVYPAAALLLPVVSYLGFYLLWNIPFSPYGTAPRLTFPYSIVMMIAFMDMARRTATQPATAKIKMKAAPAPGRRRSASARSQAGSNGPPRVKLAPVEGMVDPQ